MAWTTPRTYIASELITASILNTHVRDNLLYLYEQTNVIYSSYATETTHSNSYTDTGLTASITPSTTSTRILVEVHQAGCATNNNGYGTLKLLRGSGDLIVFGQNLGYNAAVDYQNIGTVSCAYLDSPASTSATTYKTQGRSDTGGVNFITQDDSSVSTIVLREVRPA